MSTIRAVILGSGASLPTLQRHTTAMALQREGEVFLLDCGEGAQLQWRRAGLRFGKLRSVLVSHLHGDHVNGLVGLLQTLSLANRATPLQLVGPPGLDDYIRALRSHVGMRLSYRLDLVEHRGGDVIDATGYRIVSAPLEHGVPTLGYALEEKPRPGRFDLDAARALGVPEGPLFGRLQRGETVALDNGSQVRPDLVMGPPRPGKKVAVCVDTRPCEAAVALAQGADLFICDSTFTNDLQDEAHLRGHCTAEQAARMAVDAGAQRLLLTHVSARYHDPRPLLEEARTLMPAVEVASDLMEICL